MKPVILTFDLKILLRKNLLWTIFLSILLLALNIYFQPINYEWSIWFVIKHVSLFFIYYIILIVSHETFHLVGFMLFGKVPFKSLSYGIRADEGIAFATTTQLVTNKAMQQTLLLPFWITGVVPTIIGFYFNSNTIILVGAFLMAGAIGDIVMYKALKKYPSHFLVKDDPINPILTIYEK